MIKCKTCDKYITACKCKIQYPELPLPELITKLGEVIERDKERKWR